MTEAEENKEQAIRYLFGELNENERDAMEDRIFADDEFSLFLSAVEKDLIDDFVRGEMDAALRQRFDRRYLTSESRREKARLASVLQTEVFNEKISEPEIAAPLTEPKTTFWATLADFFRLPNLALAGGLAVILLFVLFGGWFLLRRSPDIPEIVRDDNANRQIPAPTKTPDNNPLNENLKTENSNIAPTPETNINQAPVIKNKTPENNTPENNTREKRPTPAPRPTEKREETPPSQPQRIVFATLFPLLRSSSDEKPVLTVPKNAESVRLRVVHDNLKPFARYRVEIRNQNGDVIFTRETPVNQKNPAQPLSLNIKAATLGAGTYELLLSGIREDNSAAEIKYYNFSVKKN